MEALEVTNWGSNRTIVGLKPEYANYSHWTSPWQQSHHCGIETNDKGKQEHQHR